jgi:hypothetical protein
MNTLSLYLEQVTGENSLEKDGIQFREVALIKMIIDGEYFDENEPFKDSLIFFDELEESAKKSGNYLIFTCACGIAEDGGWEGVRVTINDLNVVWELDAGMANLRYELARAEYESEIKSVKDMLEENLLPVAPVSVIFPENFRR